MREEEELAKMWETIYDVGTHHMLQANAGMSWVKVWLVAEENEDCDCCLAVEQSKLSRFNF